jgi:hypothetical protein
MFFYWEMSLRGAGLIAAGLPSDFDGSYVASYAFATVSLAFPCVTVYVIYMAWLSWARSRNHRAFLWMIVPLAHFQLGYLLLIMIIIFN